MPATGKIGLFLTTATALGLCSCAVKNGRLDFTWWQDAAAPVLEDDVIIEAGGGGYYRSTPAPAEIPQASIPKEEPEAAPAATSQTAAPAPANNTTTPGTHTVQPGDTLSALARKYGTSVSALVAANGMADANVPLRINQQLRIPTGNATAPAPAATPTPPSKAPTTVPPKQTGTYTVKAGDTLYKISRQYGIKPTELMQANGLTPETANNIRVGATLRIPATK